MPDPTPQENTESSALTQLLAKIGSDESPDQPVQVIGSLEAFADGITPTIRKMQLSDLDDDCPICEANRERILAGDPPTVVAFDLPED